MDDLIILLIRLIARAISGPKVVTPQQRRQAPARLAAPPVVSNPDLLAPANRAVPPGTRALPPGARPLAPRQAGVAPVRLVQARPAQVAQARPAPPRTAQARTTPPRLPGQRAVAGSSPVISAVSPPKLDPASSPRKIVSPTARARQTLPLRFSRSMLRQQIIMNEVLQPPLALREDP